MVIKVTEPKNEMLNIAFNQISQKFGFIRNNLGSLSGEIYGLRYDNLPKSTHKGSVSFELNEIEERKVRIVSGINKIEGNMVLIQATVKELKKLLESLEILKKQIMN